MDIIYTHNRAKDNTLDSCIRLTFDICFELRNEAHKFPFKNLSFSFSLLQKNNFQEKNPLI